MRDAEYGTMGCRMQGYGIWDAGCGLGNSGCTMRDMVMPRPAGVAGACLCPAMGLAGGSGVRQRHGAGQPLPAGCPVASAA